MKYRCKVCGYVHEGEMPEDFKCPVCGADRSKFEEVKEEVKNRNSNYYMMMREK